MNEAGIESAFRVNRRQFISRAAALEFALIAHPRAFAAPGSHCYSMFPGRVIADTRLAPSVAFAAAMAGTGARVSETDGDLTSLWFDDLARHFACSNAPVSGLTSARTALVMTELARGPGVRVLWRAEHVALSDGTWRHEFEAGAAIVARAAGLAATADWTTDLGSLLADARAGLSAPAERMSAVIYTESGLSCRERTLSSWVLLPRNSPPGFGATQPEEDST